MYSAISEKNVAFIFNFQRFLSQNARNNKADFILGVIQLC